MSACHVPRASPKQCCVQGLYEVFAQVWRSCCNLQPPPEKHPWAVSWTGAVMCFVLPPDLRESSWAASARHWAPLPISQPAPSSCVMTHATPRAILTCILRKKAHEKCHSLSYLPYPSQCSTHWWSMAGDWQLTSLLRARRTRQVAMCNVQHKKQASSHFTQSRYVSKEIARMSPFVGWNGLIYLLCLELNSFWMRRYRKQNVLTLVYFKAVYTPPGKRAIKENEMCAWQAFHLILKILIVVLTGYIFKMAWTFCVL